MVGSLSILSMIITLMLSIGFPVFLAIYFYKKERYAVIALVTGALVFIITQLIIRIPLLNYFSTMPWYQKMAANLFVIALFLSITAGLFEEVGRYLGFKFPLKKHLSWENGIAFGIGHGGIESFVLTGITYINNIVYSFMINSGAFKSIIAPQLDQQTAEYLFDQLVNQPAYMFLFAGVERVFAVSVHIALSLIVLMAVIKGRPLMLLLAILLHGLVNFPAVMIPGLGLSIFYAELYLFLLAVISWIHISRSRKIFTFVKN